MKINDSLDQYQQAALRTAPRDLTAYPGCVQAAVQALKHHDDHYHADRLLAIFDRLIWCLGLAGEVGEVLDMVKKAYGHGKPLDVAALKKEFGDTRWYGAVLEHAFGFQSSDVAQTNVDKLVARYPNGFTVAAAAAKADENGGER